jgi:phosphoribosylamine--glycine ligase
MKVLVIGRLSQSPRVSALYCAPGNAGISQFAENVPIKVDDIAELQRFATDHQIDLTVVGPELPLSLGIADEFRRAKLRIFGPTRNASRIESSKSFSKELMMRCKIPTATAQTFDNLNQALQYLESHPTPVVVKADGLAQGKGVIVAPTREEAKAAVTAMLGDHQFGEAGARVMIEEFVEGEELTVMAFADGRTVVPMVAAQDHKRIGEGDTGPNTGGMGAYTPTPLINDNLRLRVLRDVLYPAIEGLSRMGSPFFGVLYAGLMITRDGNPYVLEFNARFGDPETQVVLPLLKTDLVDVLEAVAEHRLDQVHVEWHQHAAVCVVMTSEGYPGSYKKGVPITGLSQPVGGQDVVVFHAGTGKAGEEYVTNGGRVLGVTGLGADLRTARTRAYEAIKNIAFKGCYYRRDIAQKAIPTTS